MRHYTAAASGSSAAPSYALLASLGITSEWRPDIAAKRTLDGNTPTNRFSGLTDCGSGGWNLTQATAGNRIELGTSVSVECLDPVAANSTYLAGTAGQRINANGQWTMIVAIENRSGSTQEACIAVCGASGVRRLMLGAAASFNFAIMRWHDDSNSLAQSLVSPLSGGGTKAIIAGRKRLDGTMQVAIAKSGATGVFTGDNASLGTFTDGSDMRVMLGAAVYSGPTISEKTDSPIRYAAIGQTTSDWSSGDFATAVGLIAAKYPF